METQIQTEPSSNINRKKIIAIVVFCLVLIGLSVYGGVSWYQKKLIFDARLNESVYSKTNNQTFLKSLLGNDPKPLQDLFVADVNNNINDKFTKSDAYFITHRYFDNGGNIYEIYDYVQSHPQLAFLNEAEGLRPTIFDQIKNKTLTTVPYSLPSLYALLAYLEILDKHGYADLAALGTIANQYAKTAYFTKKKIESGQGLLAPAVSIINDNTQRAIFYEIKARDNMVKTLENNGFTAGSLQDRLKSLKNDPLKDILPHSLLVGLNQYAAALRYLEAAGTDISVINSPIDAQELFAFNMAFSKKFAPELKIFTSLLNASTLSLVTENADLLKESLEPIIAFDTTKTNPRGVVQGIIDAKNSKFTGLDIYSKINITTLGKRVPEFAAWLISNGWGKADFQ